MATLPAILLAMLIFLTTLGAVLWVLAGSANGADWGGTWTNHLDGLNRIFCRYYHRLQDDRLKLPESGPAIVVANHISGIDPFLLIAASDRPLRFIVASEQYHRFGLTWLFRAGGCIPVDRTGKPERAFREALKALKRGEVVGIFPHGTIHLESEPYRKLKGGAVRLAQLAGCDLYPARVDGMRAEGGLFLPALLRGRARVESFSPIICVGREVKECLADLEPLLIRERFRQAESDDN